MALWLGAVRCKHRRRSAIAVTSSEHKADSLREVGADEVIVSADLQFHKQVKALSDGGVHLSFDCVGPPTLHGSIRSLRPMGRVVVCGNVSVTRHEFNPGYFILTEVSVAGTSSCTCCGRRPDARRFRTRRTTIKRYAAFKNARTLCER